MTAAELIQFLSQHPKTCGVLGITLRKMGNHAAMVHYEMTLDDFYHPNGIKASKVRHWLGGLSTAKADEMGIDTPQDRDCPGKFFHLKGRLSYDIYPSRLAATLAAIEAALTEETKT